MNGRMRSIMSKYSEKRLSESIYEVLEILSEREPSLRAMLTTYDDIKNKACTGTQHQIQVLECAKVMLRGDRATEEYKDRLRNALHKVKTWNDMCKMTEPEGVESAF